uniref:Uncharacterized protein n=1 Tax=Oryza rufipogon TaxID=4529 RepID=A0A0E0MYY9_ORYRU
MQPLVDAGALGDAAAVVMASRKRTSKRVCNCLPVNEVPFYSWLCDCRHTIPAKQRCGFDTIIEWLRVFEHRQRSGTEGAKAMSEEATLWRLARTAIPQLGLGHTIVLGDQ